jgi:acetyltransferase
MSDPLGSAGAVIEAAKHSRKPVLTSWMGGARVAPGVELLHQAGIPTYSTPDQAVRAFSYLLAYGRRREVLYETPKAVALDLPTDRAERRFSLEAIEPGAEILSEGRSKALLHRYGIGVSKTLEAHTEEEAVAHAEALGFPVVFKLLSPDITHKSDVGGVELNIRGKAEAAQAYERILKRARQHRPQAQLDGVTVQPMIALAHAYELIVGVKRDPVFGAVLMVGAGGVAAEINQDRALELPPLSDRLARRMLESLRSWPLLRGYRGKPAVNVERLVEVLMRLSYLVADHPEILELDINPLLASPEDVIALDARIVLDRALIGQLHEPYAHLAIRPYPDEWTRHAALRDGSEVLLRAIKPEDEPLWMQMLERCSPETLHQRFRYMFKATTHEMAARFCFLDYDREVAIVAEQHEGHERRLIGVGRLIANIDHQQAEYAVLVADQWQGQGLGALLTDYCLEIGRRWGLGKIVAEMAADNHRMISLFDHRGFRMKHVADDTLQAVKDISAAPEAAGAS